MTTYQFTKTEWIEIADEVLSELVMTEDLSEAEIVAMWLNLFAGG